MVKFLLSFLLVLIVAEACARKKPKPQPRPQIGRSSADTKQDVEALQTQLGGLSNSLASLKASLTQQQGTAPEVVANLQTQISALETALSTTTQQLNAYQGSDPAKVAALNAQLKKLQADIAKLKSGIPPDGSEEMKALNEQLEAQNEEIKRLEERLNKKDEGSEKVVETATDSEVILFFDDDNPQEPYRLKARVGNIDIRNLQIYSGEYWYRTEKFSEYTAFCHTDLNMHITFKYNNADYYFSMKKLETIKKLVQNNALLLSLMDGKNKTYDKDNKKCN